MVNLQTTNDKKYYIPLEFTPETIITEEYKNTEPCWRKIGKRMVRSIMVPVTKEQYLAYMRPIWREDKRQQRHGTDEVSMDALYDAYEWEPLDDFNLEEAILNEELLSVLRHVSKMLDGIDQKILMMFANGSSEATIGKVINLSQKAVNKRKHKLFAMLREHLKNLR
ncbi:hypothetical protein [Veillonella magna]|uniref:hypothetical protein n=1 Tax=Veillonella magna TaxID=464322 RepID=UPI0023F0FC18|nr:hypothetical protein [Veillonella magna]MBD8975150.1 sigma-70 family RNA polymerase sigma factor [Veillonella magna]